MTSAPTHTCEICEVSETNAQLLSDCSSCGVLFHLNPRNDIPGIDCGDVWVGDCDEPVLQFFCNRCLELIRGSIQAEGFQAPPPGFDPLGAPPGAQAGTIIMPPVPPPAPAAPPTPPAASEPPPAAAPERPRRRRFRRIDGP